MNYKSYTLNNYKEIPQINYLSDEEIFNIEVVGSVLPFKTNNYVIDELIDWTNYKNDPLYILNFPQKEMLTETDFNTVATLIKQKKELTEIKKTINQIRLKLNPHPAGQLEHNVPIYNGIKLTGIQHKYRETVLFFPSQGQTCHAFCTFCFRWPQFTGNQELKFSMNQSDLLIDYLKSHPYVTDLLITGGDPMIMTSTIFEKYIDAILEAKIPHLKNIRIGSKSLSFWPYRFLTDHDSEDLLNVFKKITTSGLSLAFMAHFNHPAELKTDVVKQAIEKIKKTGAIIRTQSPLLKHINNSPEIWKKMWQEQVSLGLIPYYMFIARNTGAQNYFGVTINRAYEVFQQAYTKVSGICRTVRGPSMSCNAGKIQVNGVTKLIGENYFVLSFIQGRNSNWVNKPFLAKFNSDAKWIDDLDPAFGQQCFFFEEELAELLSS